MILQGRNLSFLRKNVTLNGTKCEIIHQSDSELWVIDPFGHGTSNAMIWTWFGQIPVHISELSSCNQHRLAPKIILKALWHVAKSQPLVHPSYLKNLFLCFTSDFWKLFRYGKLLLICLLFEEWRGNDYSSFSCEFISKDCTNLGTYGKSTTCHWR